MMKMGICMDAGKIEKEGKYDYISICETIDGAFQKVGLLRDESVSDMMMYKNIGDAKDLARFGHVIYALREETWFMENALIWRLYERDEELDSPGEVHEEDLLQRYRNKQWREI